MLIVLLILVVILIIVIFYFYFFHLGEGEIVWGVYRVDSPFDSCPNLIIYCLFCSEEVKSFRDMQGFDPCPNFTDISNILFYCIFLNVFIYLFLFLSFRGN